ncbi:interferon-induced very large GTPase 1-like [Clupea harengus]|uniref:Interferon-induced very large GTPase 1-like n=1 Tax=Clupea harengus TaxID=7950 RepID=A0A8M1KCG0_CLUHA|nr:interferon-induced very large GTPase 1-like [Clupea harengus]
MEQTPHSFLVFYQSEGTEPKSISTGSCSTVITGLKPATDYTVKIYTELQHGGKSQPASVQMKTGVCLSDVLSALHLEDNFRQKLTLSSVLEINRYTVSDKPAHSLKQLPWTFLRKLMMSNLNARNIKCAQDQSMYNCSLTDANDDSDAINPLDLITALFHCSDPFLQQEMVSKMSMCQFAVPLLLPNCDTQQSTLMLWAMRDLVKKFRPLAGDTTFVEGIVEMDIPMVSFVRLGESSLSKSQTLNKLLSNPHQHNDTFVHRDMECGDVPRTISDGLVEVSWYLPCGKTNNDMFTQPVAIANLRGDGRLFKTQMSFLYETSAAVFIFSDDLEGDLSTLNNRESRAELFLFTNSQSKTFNMETLRDTCMKHKVKETNVIIKKKQNDANFVEALRFRVSGAISDNPHTMKVEGMAAVARRVGILVDEDGENCENGRRHATSITENIKDIVEFKKDQLPLHGNIWKEISLLEKEMCRLRKADRNQSIEFHKSSLSVQYKGLREQQNRLHMSDAMEKFTAGISLSGTQRLYFLKWLKIQLDTLSRHNLSTLRDKYKDCCRNTPQNKELIANLDEQISNCSLGPEHFFRELGQIYECACSLPEDNSAPKKVQYLPALCAQMLLNGFPVELVDGDASNIPMKWIKEVLTQLHQLVDTKSKIRVLTVLGVQSTGKSTLLNTMFGVQFAVSSGRCTRGAFMLLIKVSEELRSELKCDFIMIIDTEGLKSPELAALDTSYEHDNELATLVIGLSDITIMNIAMENITEMKDILQIVVHAFLRMKEVGKKPRCLFVHQNVSDMSAHDCNMRDRKKLMEQLDEMTQIAAKMEKKEEKYKNFTDVMKYNPDKDSYYIPGLWHGTPPMAPVNAGYTEAVYELKKSLIGSLQTSDNIKTNDVTEFLRWTQDLWKAVKFENFIFNFRNSLVADAYTDLCTQYNTWEWSFRSEMNKWLITKETKISNFGVTEKNVQMNLLRTRLREWKHEASEKLREEEQTILSNLDTYFQKKDSKVCLVEKYKQDFQTNRISVMKRNNTDYHETYIRDLLKAVDDQKDLQISDECETSLKVHVCGCAAMLFQKSHKEFNDRNDPQNHLLKCKPIFLEKFRESFSEKDQCQKRAKQFTETCVKPAVEDYVSKHLGQAIADHMKMGDGGVTYRGVTYNTRTNLLHDLFKQLFHDNSFQKYKEYTTSYETFVKNWIKEQIIEEMSSGEQMQQLERKLLPGVVKRITDKITSISKNMDIEEFIRKFCSEDQLVFPRDALDSFLILLNAKTDQFAINLKEFIEELESHLAQWYANKTGISHITERITHLPSKPHELLFSGLCGCGKQCPFCGTPCEAGGQIHETHFSSMHRSEAFAQYRWTASQKLVIDICTTLVISDSRFKNSKTSDKWHPYKRYREIYPEWDIRGDPNTEASTYWKYVMTKFNNEFAKAYDALPADIPEAWKTLTAEDALKSLDKIHIVEVRIAESSTAEGGQEEFGPEIVLRHPQGSGLINKELVAWAEKKYKLSKQEVQVKKKYNIPEARGWWPKRKFLAVYESWGRMECQHTTDLIQQLKREVAELKKKLEACESRDGLAFSPRGWLGPPGGRDQLGAVVGMYPNPSAPPPNYELGMASSGGHGGEPTSMALPSGHGRDPHTSMFASPDDSYPGDHVPIESTPYPLPYLFQQPYRPAPTPRQQLQQQDQHPPQSNEAAAVPTSPDAASHTEEASTSTGDSVVRDDRDMSLTRGADGAHGAASRRQAAKFVMCEERVEDADEEIKKLRPVKRMENVEGTTIMYEPASPNQIEKWSKDMEHPKRGGLKPWMTLKELKVLYDLHPYDALAILHKHLNSCERTLMRAAVEEALGAQKLGLDAGWAKIKDWIVANAKSQLNWAKVTACLQKKGETLDDFNDRFLECYTLHSGHAAKFDLDTLPSSTDTPLKTLYLQQILPELQKGIKTRMTLWEDDNKQLQEVMNVGYQVERDEQIKIRALTQQNGEKKPAPDKKNTACHNCGKKGHWRRECKEPKRPYRPHSSSSENDASNYARNYKDDRQHNDPRDDREEGRKQWIRKLQAMSLQELDRLGQPDD